jgi:putative membrane-bound dehydrogenase-like protein
MNAVQNSWKKVLTGGACLLALPLGAAEFPTIYNSEAAASGQPVPAAESAAMFKLPPGFKATVFAAEPDVQNPIAMAWDARGRLWIAENYTYAESGKKFDRQLRDRVLIFEDAKGDGRFTSRKVFTEEVQLLTSVEVGQGGVWLMAPPQVLFIPDRNRDDIPDGPAEVVLDGFTVPPENYHNFANGLHWGPDGWLYGRCGASAAGEVGPPGTPANRRVPMRGGLWRYHPQRKVFESLGGGATNPWGHDWNEYGEAFYINTVNGHLWHMMPGAHFVRPHTIDPNPRTYGLIDTHADHWHWDNNKTWQDSRNVTGLNDTLGGGHAHIGEMIYLGDNWPAEYRGHLFTLNQHGRRMNQDILERSGSGYVGRHGKDVFFTDDKWFRGIELGYGPDGGVMVLDWNDTGECHDHTGVYRTSGRIYKLTHGTPVQPKVGDLAKLGDAELVKLQLHANEWFVRQARRQLAERAVAGKDMAAAVRQVRELFSGDGNTVHQLRALWCLYSIGAADENFLLAQLKHQNEHVRTWAVRLLGDFGQLDTTLSQRLLPESQAISAAARKEFVRLAGSDASGLVRLALASMLQRLPPAARAELAAPLLGRAGDAGDHNLPLMLWYGLIPMGEADPAALARLGVGCELPITRQCIARRLGEDIEKNPGPINDLLMAAVGKPEAFQADVLDGLSEALKGWRKAKAPAAWDGLQKKLAAAADPKIRERVRDLAVVFGDGRALDEVKRVALDKAADLNVRKAALQTLIDNQPPDLREVCEQLLSVRFLNAVAVRGLARFDDAALGEKLARSYRGFHTTERAAVLDTLVSRPTFARALLAELAAGRFPRADVTPFHARQIRSFNDPELTRQLSKAWGELRDSAADKQEFMAKLRAELSTGTLARGNLGQGRLVYNLACANCHTLYGHGGQVGPDLTGAGRDNLDYILENVVDPSSVVNADFRMVIANLKDGRVINGVVAAKSERTLTLKTMTEVMTIERAQLESMQESALSIMPEGLMDGLTAEQRRDLVAYLMHKSQVPLPAEK